MLLTSRGSIGGPRDSLNNKSKDGQCNLEDVNSLNHLFCFERKSGQRGKGPSLATE